MKIVLIAQRFFPALTPRAFRVGELAKEFARKGHDVTVYAVLGNYDYSFFEKVHNLKVRNLGDMKFSSLNSDLNSKRNLLEKILSKLFGQIIEFPDLELSFKVAKALRKENSIDLLITVAWPFPIHWGAAYASKWFNKNKVNKWVADCGDPYMGNKLIKHPFYFKYVEKWFCRKVDYITIPIKEAKDAYYKEFRSKIKVIPQGFNFEEVTISKKEIKNETITFIYAGVFYKGIRDPGPFLDYLSKLDIDFKFIIYTRGRFDLSKYKITLKNKLEIHDFIPRVELIKVMSQADFLVNIENNTVVQSPSKLIDYALSKRPILSVKSFDINKRQINQFLNADYTQELIIENVEQYNIKNVAIDFVKLSKII